jgi:hypothetical protein
MGSVQLLMTPSASLPSPSTGRPIQRRFQSHNEPFSNSPANLVSPSRPMGSIQLLMTAVQQLQPILQPPLTSLAAQVPAQSQHWQASGLPTVGGPSTFQPYAMAPPVTAPACGQLKVVHLAKVDYSFLDQLQAAADKAPFSTNISLRNEWCIAPEVSNGSFMQSWFLAVKIDSFSGVQRSLLNNAEVWRSVPNDAFFSAIRSAWTAYTTSLPAWDSQQPAALREDPDVAQLRASSLGAFIGDTPTMALPLMQSRILDVTARARSAGHRADWQREGDIVIGWINKLKAQGRATAPGALGASYQCNGPRSAKGSWHSTDQPSQPRSRLGPTPYSSGFPQRTTMQPAAHAAARVPSGSS